MKSDGTSAAGVVGAAGPLTQSVAHLARREPRPPGLRASNVRVVGISWKVAIVPEARDVPAGVRRLHEGFEDGTAHHGVIFEYLRTPSMALDPERCLRMGLVTQGP